MKNGSFRPPVWGPHSNAKVLLQSHLYIDEKQRYGVTLNNGTTRHNGLTKNTEPEWATSFGVVSQWGSHRHPIITGYCPCSWFTLQNMMVRPYYLSITTN